MQGGKHKGGDDGESNGDKGGEVANWNSGKDTSVQGSEHTNGSKRTIHANRGVSWVRAHTTFSSGVYPMYGHAYISQEDDSLKPGVSWVRPNLHISTQHI